MKKRLYEMKLNGLSRLKIPISSNEILIDQCVKKVYQEHILVNRLIGDKLNYDQYIFIYDSIKFIMDSSAKDVVKLRDELLFNEILPQHIILSSLKHMLNIIEKMKDECVLKKENFNLKNYFQPLNMELESNDYLLLNTWDLKVYENAMTKEIKEKIAHYDKEREKYGRFWMLEGFIRPADKEIWIDALMLLKDINTLVIDDIRDYILNLAHFNKMDKIEEAKKDKQQHQPEESKKIETSKNLPKSQNSIKNLPKTREREKSGSRRPSKLKKDLNQSLVSIDSDDEFNLKQKPKKEIKKR